MVKKRMLKLFVCVFAIGLTTGLAHADITSDLVGHWTMDDGSGATAADSSTILTHDAGLAGTYLWKTGLVGSGCLNCNTGRAATEATSDYSAGAGGLMEDGKLTVACWVKHDSLSIDNQTYFAFYTNSNNRVYFFKRPSGQLRTYMLVAGAKSDRTTSKSLITDTEWHHVAVVLNGASFSYYMDGEFVVTMTLRSLTNWVGEPHFCMASRYADSTSRPFYGSVDDVRLYDRLLTEDDLQELVSLAQYPPTVDAGPMQSVLWQGSPVTLQMDATVTDDGNPVPPSLTYTWSQISGPGTVTFDPCDIVDPCVTFPAAGIYELNLNASDGEKAVDDTVLIRFRSTNDPIAYWNFETGNGTNVVDRSANNNFGTLAGDLEPNWVDGWVDSGALEFCGVGRYDASSYATVTTDTTIDPNLDTLQYEVTLAAWFKINDLANTYYPAIIANSNTGWRLYVETLATNVYGKVTFTPGDSLSGSRASSTRPMDDGYWHHVVGIYDGSKSYLYIDGVLDVTVDNAGLLDTTDSVVPVTIGARSRKDDFTVERSWNGLLDDVYVYDYAISASQVDGLSAMGNLVPIVDAGEDETFYMQNSSLQLAATVIDDGKGDPAVAELKWTADPCTGVSFSDDTIEDPIVTFPEVGTYVLTLTADDGSVISDSVTIAVENPTCQDIIADGLLKSADISGPEGTPDCYIDLYDFAALAGDWLRCNNPQDPGCELLY